MLITKELRLFGEPLSNIKSLKDYLLAHINSTSFEERSGKEIRELLQKAAPQTLNGLIKDDLNKENITNLLKELPDQYKMYFTNIGGLVSSVLLFGYTPSLMLYKCPLENNSDFKISIFNPIAHKLEAESRGNDFRDELVTNLINYTIVNIPIVPLISKFYNDEVLFKYAETFALYSPSELEILKIFKQRDFKQIKIYNSHNKKTFEVEITEERDIKNNEALTVKTLLGLKEYERAEVIFRNNKHIVIKNIIKQQI